MNRSFITLLITVCSTAQLSAQNEIPDINLRTTKQNTLYRILGDFVSDYSAAASFFRYEHSFTQLDVRMNLRREEEAIMPQLGDGNTQGSFHVTSGFRLNPHSVAFAGANYSNGKKSNVCWNSTADYELLYPYLLADSIGGNLNHEQYQFYGGYARNYKRVNIGIEAFYRALQEHRNTDPRPRNIASDLSASLSVGIILKNYNLGTAGGFRLYRQEQSVDFYNDSGANTSELHLTGLGTFYSRYSGTDYNDTRYQGTGFHVALTLIPLHHNGWYALTNYNNMTILRKLAGANMAELTRLKNQTITAGTAYCQEEKHFGWGVKVTAIYNLREGTENILGSGSSNDNHPLAGQLLYKNHKLNVCLEGCVRWTHAQSIWTLYPTIEYLVQDEEYVYPKRKQNIKLLHAGTNASHSFLLSNGWMLDTNAGIQYAISSGNKFNIPANVTDSRIFHMTYKQYQRLTSNHTTLNMHLRTQKALSETTAIFFSALYTHRLYEDHLQDYNVQLSTGLCF